MSRFGGSHVLRDLACGVFVATGLPMARQSAPARPAPVSSAEPPAPVPPPTADAAGYVETGPAPAPGKTAAAYNKMGSDDQQGPACS